MTGTARLRPWVSALGALAIVVTGCGGTAAPGGSSAASAGSVAAASGSAGAPGSAGASGTATEWSRANDGTSLSMIAEATLNSQVLDALLPAFAAKTGIDVQLE